MDTPVEHPGTFAPNRFRTAREVRGITRWALADKCGVQVRDIKRWEDARELPTATAVLIASSYLGFPLDFFYQPDIELIDEERDSLFICKIRS